MDTYYIVPEDQHNALVAAGYRHRGYHADEAEEATRVCAQASRHGIRTHNGIKALHLDHILGSAAGGCVPGAEIVELPSRFAAAKVWNSNKKLGQSVALRAMDAAIKLADQYGVGIVSVDNAFHYLWGGGYVMSAAERGYIAYTNCPGALTEVVPFGGKYPTIGTNPHSWGFPTTPAIGFPIVVDWATSVVAMGRVQQFRREGKPLPPNAAVDKDGNPTTDANAAVSLLPFGGHKGYGLALIDELVAAMIGASLPTLRCRLGPGQGGDDKRTCTFFFQVIHPDAVSGGAFAKGRNQSENLQAVIRDILGHGNDQVMLPGQPEAEWAAKTKAAGGLLFTQAELAAFNELAAEIGQPAWQVGKFKTVSL